jgi:gliding motility-associated-like protein
MLWFAFLGTLSAQTTTFPGGTITLLHVPDTIIVDGNCVAPLNWGGDDSVQVVYNVAFLGTKKFKSVSTGVVGGPIPGGTTVTVTYEISYFSLLFPNPQVYLYSFPIYFADKTAPVFASIPPSVTVSCGANPPTPIATDNCDTNPAVTFTNTTNTTSCAGGSYIRTWKATDDYGNAAIKTQTIVVSADTTPPTFTTAPTPLTVNCDANTATAIQTWLNNHGGAVATDACGAVTWSSTPNLGNLNAVCPGNTVGVVVKFTATDACGLTSTATVTLTVNDNNPPVVTKVATNNITTCGANTYSLLYNWIAANGNSTATDACSTISTSYQLNGASATLLQIDAEMQAQLAAANCQSNVTIGTNTYNKVLAKLNIGFVYQDACGNIAAPTTATFAVLDTIAPTITKQAFTTTVPCSSPNVNGAFNIWYNNSGGATASDDCSTATFVGVPSLANALIALDQSRLTGCNGTGSVSVNFYATDKCGNQNPVPTIALFQITDTNAPTFTKPTKDTLVECNTTGQAALQSYINNHGKAVATDNCGSVTWTYTWKDKNNAVGQNTAPTVPSNNCTWFVDIKFIASDACGNKDSIIGRFGLKDSQAPTFTGVPANVTVSCKTIPAVTNPVASDNCSTPMVIFIETQAGSNPCDTGYVILRTWFAKDSCNNTSKVTQKIRVKDTQAPMLMGVPIDMTVACNAITPPLVILANDDCDTSKTAKLLEISGKDTNPLVCGHYNYPIFRTWTATDQCNNTATLAQVIMVEDVVKPSFTAPANITVECYQVQDLTLTGNVTNVADNCMAAPIVSKIDTYQNGVCPIVNTISRAWTVSDACGNKLIQTQTITSRDTKKPYISGVPNDITVECGAAIPFPKVIITDSCSTKLTIVRDSTITQISGCAGVKTILRKWTATDECGNSAVKSYTITTNDTQPPSFAYPLSDVTVANNPSDCDATAMLNPPLVKENCGATSSNEVIGSGPQSITHTGAGDVNEIPVDAVTLTFPVSISATSLATNVALEIFLNKVDGEDVGEYFNIIGEDGTLLGKTNNTPTQCGSSTTNVTTLTVQQVNTWGQDGTITLTLKPNIPVGQAGRFAINNICAGANVDAKLTYQLQTSGNVQFEYTIDNDPKNPATLSGPTPVTLSMGQHTIVYYITDCSNNTSTASYLLTVKDTEKPTMACPADITQNANAVSCSIPVVLPLPTKLNDNCGFGTTFSQTQPTTPAAALLQFEYNPNFLEYMAMPKTFIFTNITSNLLGGNISLDLNLQADGDDATEYFEIQDENGIVVGNTTPSDCVTETTTTFTFSSSTFNTWAADGIITFKAVPFSNFPISAVGTSPGISPCNNATVQNGDNDGTSYLSAKLSYATAIPQYYTTGATTLPIKDLIVAGATPTVNFNSGLTKVWYVLSDKSNNKDTCFYTVNIKDITPPVAKCAPTTIFINPSGLVNYQIKPSEIDGGSTDNCGIDTAWVTQPAVLPCNNAGNLVPVTLTVRDKAGNTASCFTQVKIEVGQPKPTAQLGICGNDTLRLYANPPAAPGNVVYTFLWSGPNNFQSNAANPVIPKVKSLNSGTYTVQIQGFSGCSASGSVSIQIEDQPNTPSISTPDNTPCTNESIVLKTTSYTGSVKYFWYKGSAPSGALLDSTATATYSVANPAAGISSYYVVVKLGTCTSNPSVALPVNVIVPPVALLINPPTFEICVGDNITLGTPVAGANFTYKWSGPNAFASTVQYPSVITNAAGINSGTYNLIIENNGCYSDPVSTSVNVKPLPAKPQIAISGSTCENNTITIIANVTGGDVYHWVRPNFTELTTTTNTLTLNNLNSNQSGNWSLYITKNACNSPKSNDLLLQVYPLPAVSAGSNSPVCANGTLNLNATSPTGVTFTWSGPNGFTAIGKTISTPAVAGTYNVNVMSAEGCAATQNTLVGISTPPSITAVSNTGLPCVTGAQNIKLIPTITPADNGTYTYKWSGPNTFFSTSTQPILPNGTSTDNGTYTLIVTDATGCSSSPNNTVVDVKDVPNTPSLTFSDKELCIGEKLNIVSNTYVGTSVKYKWYTPKGTFFTSTPAFKLDSVTLLDKGNYYMNVEVDGCQSLNSATSVVVVNPTPSVPNATSNSPICEGENILLNTPFINDAVYEWIGPKGFNSSIHNPVVTNAAPDNSGFYQIRIIVKGCASKYAGELNVTVNPRPITPIVTNNSPVCADKIGANVTFNVSANTAIVGATYTWMTANNNQTLGATSSPGYTWNGVGALPEGTYNIFTIATSALGCKSFASANTIVTVNKIPSDKAFAGDDIPLCDLTTTKLNAQAPSVGTGMWTYSGTGTPNITSPALANTTVTNLSVGKMYPLVWALSNGACQNYSTDTTIVSVGGTTELADAGDTIHICSNTVGNLNAKTPSSTVKGHWTQATTQAQLGVSIVNPNDPKSQVTGLQAGNSYIFTWSLSNAGCKDYTSDVAVISVSVKDGKAYAGADFTACGEGNILLKATSAPITGFGKWQSLNSNVNINAPQNPQTTVLGLTPGINRFVWSVGNAGCGFYSRDTVLVTYENAVKAIDDSFTLPYAQVSKVVVTQNDLVINDFILKIKTLPLHGNVQILPEKGTIMYKPAQGYAGADAFAYQICNKTCPDVCADAKVALSIGNDNDCTIPTIFSPNADGTNDFFEIPCLATSKYPNNNVIIVNQWGNEVFRAAPYQNNWEGTFDGQALPNGTYFYIVDFGDGQAKKGFLMLER